MKIKIKRLGLIFFLLFLMKTNLSFAHKVNIFAYVEADTVYTESYFPDGKKVQGGKISVYDSAGNKLLEGTTDQEGRFNFKLPKYDDLKIVVEASLGHQSSYLLSKEEIPYKEVVSKEEDLSPQPQAPVISDKDLLILRKEIASLKELILKSQEKESLREVVAGIGYIFGIMGIMFYFLSKKR